MTPFSRPLVVIGFAEAFAAIEAAWSLQAAGLEVAAFTRSGSSSALRRIPGVTIVDIPAPEKDLSAARSALSELMSALDAHAFFPLDDSSLWLSRNIELGRTIVVGPDSRGVRFALDKSEQVIAAMRAGLNVPKTRQFPDIAQAWADHWPVFLKPSDAVMQVENRLVRPNGRICADEAELLSARKSMLPGPVLRQALVHGRGEGIFGYVDAHGPTDLSAHRRVRMLNPHGSASSACESIPVDDEIAAKVSTMLEQVAWRGLFMAEFLRDADGRAWFMELNGRAWGSLALARHRGYEYPAWAVQSALGLPKDPGSPTDPPSITARHLGREIGHLAFVLRGPQTTAAVDWPKRGQTIRNLLTIRRRDRLYNWNASQPFVLASDTWQTIAALARSQRRRNT